MNEIPELYAVAKELMLDAGLPYTDPRTGVRTDPPSRSRKKRRQVGHRDNRGTPVRTIKVSHPKSRRIKARKARKAMGARGVKTNRQRSGRN
jgi:hypothetical protein